jgi:hypothetical protein
MQVKQLKRFGRSVAKNGARLQYVPVDQWVISNGVKRF